MIKQEIKKEVVLQMIWDRHFEWGMEKDLDDACEDIYNDVFVPLLSKVRRKTIKDIISRIEDLEHDELKEDGGCEKYFDKILDVLDGLVEAEDV